MKKLTFIFGICCLISASIHAQSGEVSQIRTVGTFSGVEVCCGIRVILKGGNSTAITVKAKPDVQDALKIVVKGGVLTINFDEKQRKKISDNRINVIVYVSQNNLTNLEVSSGGSIENETQLNAKNLKLEGTSGGNITLNSVKVDNLDCSASSGANIILSGSASYANIDASSGANLRLKKLIINKADVDASSGASVTVNAKDELKADASSAADIVYYGDRSNNKVSSSSSGSVKRGK